MVRKNRILQACLSMVFTMLFLGTAGAVNGESESVVPHEEVCLAQSTLEERILKASVILVGRVEAIGDLTHPEVVGRDRASFSLDMEVILSVSKWIKGKSPEKIVLITGQQNTNIAVISPSPPRFNVGEEILLLTSPWKAGYYQTVGWHKAKYGIIDDRIAGSDVRVEEFVQEIQELHAGERSKIMLNLPGRRDGRAKIAHSGQHLDGQFYGKTNESWRQSNLPAVLYYNPTNAPTSDSTLVMCLIRNAASTWDGVTTSFMDFYGPYETTTGTPRIGNGKNELYWEDIYDDDTYAAETTLSPQPDYFITASDIRFDTYPTNWHISSSTSVPAGEVDFQTVALHELGHSQGLGDKCQYIVNTFLCQYIVNKSSVLRCFMWVMVGVLFFRCCVISCFDFDS